MARKKRAAEATDQQLPLGEPTERRGEERRTKAKPHPNLAGAVVEKREADRRQPGERLRVHRLSVRNFGGVGDEPLVLDFDPAVTVLAGENASSKSSVLAALRCALGIDRMSAGRRGHIEADGTRSAPQLEVTLLGDDHEIHVQRSGDGSPEVRERVGEDWRQVARPVEFLRDLVDVAGAVPAGFLEAKDDDRVTLLLEALELDGYDRAAALAGAGLAGFRLPPIPGGLHPLEDLEQVMRSVFDSRTEVNRQERAERDAAGKLLDGLPAEAPGGVEEELGEVEEELRTSERDLAGMEERAGTAEREALILAKAQRDEAIAEAEAAYQRACADARGALGEAKAVQAPVWGVIQGARERLAALREQQRSADTDRHVRAQAQEGEARADRHAKRAAELTGGLKALKRYASDLAGRLPIKGLEVSYDDKGRRTMTLEGIPLAELNSGRLQELADEVAALHTASRAGDRPTLPLLLADVLERVDADRRGKHLRALTSSGLQVVAAVVDEGPLRILRGPEAVGGAS